MAVLAYVRAVYTNMFLILHQAWPLKYHNFYSVYSWMVAVCTKNLHAHRNEIVMAMIGKQQVCVVQSSVHSPGTKKKMYAAYCTLWFSPFSQKMPF